MVCFVPQVVGTNYVIVHYCYEIFKPGVPEILVTHSSNLVFESVARIREEPRCGSKVNSLAKWACWSCGSVGRWK